MFGFSFPSHWQWISTDLSKKSGMFGDLGSRSTTTWELLIEELPLMLTAAVTSGLPHPPKLSFSRGEDCGYNQGNHSNIWGLWIRFMFEGQCLCWWKPNIETILWKRATSTWCLASKLWWQIVGVCQALLVLPLVHLATTFKPLLMARTSFAPALPVYFFTYFLECHFKLWFCD